MNRNLLIRKAVSSCLMVAMIATYSMVVLANTDRAVGELIVSGGAADGTTPVVMINGEAAKTGRTIFSSSTISTPENTSATVNMGLAGEIVMSSNATAVLSFDASSINADLSSGTLTVLNSKQPVNVNIAGVHHSLSSGETASAAGAPADDHDYRDSSGKCIDANKDGKLDCDAHAGAWWAWALVFGGATAGIIIGASQGSNNITLGGGGTVVSPTR